LQIALNVPCAGLSGEIFIRTLARRFTPRLRRFRKGG
jgi:hypothetical protein